MNTAASILAAAAIFAAAAPLHAVEVSGRRMVWAHYVPWYLPGDASLLPHRFRSFPLDSVGADPIREEIGRAMAMGINGFFNDMVAHEGGETSYWDLRPFLKAAEGTPFLFGICLDGNFSAEHQTRELVKMLSTYGDHPNYPKCKGRYVVATFAFLRKTPDEWRAIRKGCEDAGFPLHLVANVETPFKAFDPVKLEPYAGTFERAYHFGCLGMDRGRRKSLEREISECAAFCREHGASYMPSVWPGYFGAWMMGVNCFYQPFCGFDTAQRHFEAWRLVPEADWLHLTTWNDHAETALMPRRLVPGNRAAGRAMADEFKGEPPTEKSQVVFSYFREVIPGSMLRFEAMRLPSSGEHAVAVSGILRDAEGNVVCELPEKTFGTEGWARLEWLVSTTHLAESPTLVPEFSIRHFAQPRTGEPPAPRQIRAPRIFFSAGWLSDPVTVKVSEDDCASVDSSLSVSYAGGLLRARCDFAAEKTARRIVLHRNDRPVTAFRRKAGKTLNLLLQSSGDIELKTKDARIVCAVKSGETNGAPNFAWTPSRILSRKTPGWAMLSACIEAEADDAIVFTGAGKSVRFTPASLVASGTPAWPTRWSPPGIVAGSDLRPQRGAIWLDEEGTACDLPTLDMDRGCLTAEVWMTQPGENDAYWVEFEFADGSFAESDVVYPFAKTREPVETSVVETPVTLDHPSGATGAPDAKVFLAPQSEWPVRETRVVDARVSPLAVRRARFDFQGEPMLRPMLPHRCWPMGPFRLVCHFTRIAENGDGAGRIVGVEGWNEGPELRLLPDGRIEAAYCGGSDFGAAKFRHAVQSLQPLEVGRRAEIAASSDGRTLRLWVDGELHGETPLPALRTYGNLAPALGAGVNGETPTTGLLHDLEIMGSPAER